MRCNICCGSGKIAVIMDEKGNPVEDDKCYNCNGSGNIEEIPISEREKELMRITAIEIFTILCRTCTGRMNDKKCYFLLDVKDDPEAHFYNCPNKEISEWILSL